MESNGQLIVIKKGEGGYSNLLVSEGNIQEDNLKHIGKDDDWLKEELEKYNITDLSELFIVEYSGDGKLFIVKKQKNFKREKYLNGDIVCQLSIFYFIAKILDTYKY